MVWWCGKLISKIYVVIRDFKTSRFGKHTKQDEISWHRFEDNIRHIERTSSEKKIVAPKLN